METRRLGEDAGDFPVSSSTDLREVSCLLAEQARQRLWLSTQALDPGLYDNSRFAEAVRRLATSGRYAQIRILVRDPAAAARMGHRLIDLAQRLPSFIELRRPAADHADSTEAFLLADGSGYAYRTQADRYEAQVDFRAPPRVQELAKLFTQMWEQAQPDQNLRRLHL
jgi:hypothetical protein